MPINTKELDVKLEVLLKKVFKIQKIDLEVSIEDISEWDSLTHVQLISAIEKEFKIKFALGELETLRDVGAMVDLMMTEKLK